MGIELLVLVLIVKGLICSRIGLYDSSRIEFGEHPLYGSINMYGYENITKTIYRCADFMEFEATTFPIMGKQIPISGGGYLRLLPWILMKSLINQYLKQNDLYVFYIHPFELSELDIPAVPSSTSTITKFRFSHGRNRVVDKIIKLVSLFVLRLFIYYF